MKSTPITQLIEFINDTAVTKDISDDVKNALSEFSIYITEKALELQLEEKEVLESFYNNGAEDSGEVSTSNYGEVFYNETFGALPVAPVMMNQEEFDKHVANAEKVD